MGLKLGKLLVGHSHNFCITIIPANQIVSGRYRGWVEIPPPLLGAFPDYWEPCLIAEDGPFRIHIPPITGRFPCVHSDIFHGKFLNGKEEASKRRWPMIVKRYYRERGTFHEWSLLKERMFGEMFSPPCCGKITNFCSTAKKLLNLP